MEGLHSLLHTVGFFSIFLCKSYLCSSRSRQTQPERGRGESGLGGRQRERQRQSECARVRLSEHLVSVPAITLSARKGGGDEKSLLGPCSLLMVAHALTQHSHAHTRTDNKRGSGGSHAQGRRPRTQTHRRRSRAACDRMRQLPVSLKTIVLCQYLVLRMRVLSAFAALRGLHDLLLNIILLSLFSFILPLRSHTSKSPRLGGPVRIGLPR
jgi:hypothetical protein